MTFTRVEDRLEALFDMSDDRINIACRWNEEQSKKNAQFRLTAELTYEKPEDGPKYHRVWEVSHIKFIRLIINTVFYVLKSDEAM
jgi:hypothetical protein